MITTKEVAHRHLPRNPEINSWIVEYYELFLDLRQGKTIELGSRITYLTSNRPDGHYTVELADLFFYLDTVADETSAIPYASYAELIERMKRSSGDRRQTKMLMLKHEVVLAAAYDNQVALGSLTQKIENAKEYVQSNGLAYNKYGYFNYLALQVRFESARSEGNLDELSDVLDSYDRQSVVQPTPQLRASNAYNRLKVYRELLAHEAVRRKYLQAAIRAVGAANREVSLLHNPGLARAVLRISSDIYQVAADIGSHKKENEYFARRARDLSRIN